MKKAILFDLDGTLWDSSAECTEAWNDAIRTQTNRPEQFTVDDMHGFMGKTMEVIAALMFPSLPQDEQIRLIRLCTEWEHEYLRDHHPTLYPNEQSILVALAEKYVLGVVSNCQDGYIQLYLEQCGFSSLFRDFECAGRTGKSKGQNIRLVMERQGVSECIYVGDTQGDCDAAREAGVKFIHASYGFGTVDGCDAALHSLGELPQAVAELF